MAQYSLHSQRVAEPGNRYEVLMLGTIDGRVVTTYNPLPVSQVGATSTTAFGEPYAIPLTPVLQVDGVYGLNPRDWETTTYGGGNVATNAAVITLSSGTGIGDYAQIRTKQLLRYRPGQGALARFTAAFPTPSANTSQRAGFTSQEQSIMVGYNGTQFGVVRINGGKSDIRSLTINSAAVGSETANITLDGTSYSISISAGNTVQVASQIAAYNFGSSWIVEQVNSTVKIAAAINGPKTGTYAFSSSGSVTGSYSQIQTGVVDTQNWTYQSAFNMDTLDGTANTLSNPSGMTIDPSKINVYQINYRWLGVGEIRYAIESPTTGQMIFFHKEHYSGQHLTPHLDNPSMRLGYITANKSTGVCANTSTVGICMMGAIEGLKEPHGYTFSKSSGDVKSLSADVINHVLSLRNPIVFDGRFNLKVSRLQRISVAFQGNDPVELYLFLNPTYSSRPLWSSINSQLSTTYFSTTTATFTIGTDIPIFTQIVPINGGETYDLQNLNIELSPNYNLAFAVKSGQSISTINIAAIWSEE